MRRLLVIVSLVLMIASLWIAMGPGQIAPVKRNILYAHVPSSVCALLSFVVILIASIAYLATSKSIYDQIAFAAAEVGTIYATVLNVTGMLFSRAEWNIWWTPSPRLLTSAILWLLYVVYLILRTSMAGSERQKAKTCAIYGIIAFIDVPLVFISARFLPDIHRPNFSFTSHWQSTALMMGMAAMACLAASLIWLKTDYLRTRKTLEQKILY